MCFSAHARFCGDLSPKSDVCKRRPIISVHASCLYQKRDERRVWCTHTHTHTYCKSPSHPGGSLVHGWYGRILCDQTNGFRIKRLKLLLPSKILYTSHRHRWSLTSTIIMYRMNARHECEFNGHHTVNRKQNHNDFWLGRRRCWNNRGHEI